MLQEANLPLETPEELEDVAGSILAHLPADDLPYLTEMIVDHGL